MARITFVIPSLSVGGTERQLVYLIGGLVRDNEVSVICTRHDGALGADVRRLGAKVRVLGIRTAWDFSQRSQLAHALRAYRPDIMHSFLFGFDYFANRAARDADVPVIISSRRQLAEWKKLRHVWFQRLANRYSDCIVANSRAVADFAAKQERRAAGDYRVIHNGIDADAFLSTADPSVVRKRFNIPSHRRIVGIVANFSPVKNHALFVDMAVDLIRRHEDLHFVMVGTGPLAKSVERRIARCGLDGCFTRIATVAELPDLYAMMSVVVLCSRNEGFPNVIMEALAAGRPVVASNVGGIPELVSHGEHGLLMNSIHSSDFAEAVGWMLDNADEATAMGARGARRIRAEFGMDTMIRKYRSLYAELLRAKLGDMRGD